MYTKDNQRKGRYHIMTSKKQTLKMYFETMCANMYEAEFEAYKQAVKERGTKYYPSFSDWLEHFASNSDVLKEAIEFAGYHYPQNDRTWLTAIYAFDEVGCKLMQHA